MKFHHSFKISVKMSIKSGSSMVVECGFKETARIIRN